MSNRRPFLAKPARRLAERKQVLMPGAKCGWTRGITQRAREETRSSQKTDAARRESCHGAHTVARRCGQGRDRVRHESSHGADWVTAKCGVGRGEVRTSDATRASRLHLRETGGARRPRRAIRRGSTKKAVVENWIQQSPPGEAGFAFEGGRLGETSRPETVYSVTSPVRSSPPLTFTFSRIALVIFSASSGFSLRAVLAASRPWPTRLPS